jgi:hypothetical protein
MLLSSPSLEDRGTALALLLCERLRREGAREENKGVQPRSFEEGLTTLEPQMLEVRELPDHVTTVESQLVQLRQETSSEFFAMRDKLKSDVDETQAFTKVLYEDVLARLKVIGEGNDSAR